MEEKLLNQEKVIGVACKVLDEALDEYQRIYAEYERSLKFTNSVKDIMKMVNPPQDFPVMKSNEFGENLSMLEDALLLVRNDLFKRECGREAMIKKTSVFGD